MSRFLRRVDDSGKPHMPLDPDWIPKNHSFPVDSDWIEVDLQFPGNDICLLIDKTLKGITSRQTVKIKKVA